MSLPDLTISGPEAVIRWGYHRAAVLGPWSMTRRADGMAYDVTATVTSVNAHQIAEDGLTLTTEKPWRCRWPITSHTIVNSTFTATLGQREDA